LREDNNQEKLQPFADEFLESVITFPNAESRDLVDTMTQVLSYLKDNDVLMHKTDIIEEDEPIIKNKRFY
jgi:hypothetical protein